MTNQNKTERRPMLTQKAKMAQGNLWIVALAVLSSILGVTSFPMAPEFPRCPNIRADVIFLVPASDRTYSEIFENHLIQLMTFFDVPGQVRIGLQIYGTTTVTELSPAEFKSIKQIRTRMTRLSNRQNYAAVLSNIGQDYARALNEMKREFDLCPPGVRKMGVIYTEGVISRTADERKAVLDAADAMKSSGVILYNLGARYSGFRGGDEFETIGTDFCRLFGLGPGFGGLTAVIPFLATAICAELDPDTKIESGSDCFPRFYASEKVQDFSCPYSTQVMDHPDPTNCAYFYRCIPLFPRPIRYRCPDQTLFNSNFIQGDYNNYCVHFEQDSCYTD